MPKQVQMSSVASKFGGQVAAANAQYKDKPVDTGNMQLPPGIKNGIARLQSIGWYEQEEDKKEIPKGGLYCTADAVCVWPIELDGVKCEGLHTRPKQIPLCDIPQYGYKKVKWTFQDGIGKFVNLLKQVSNGTMVCQHTNQDDPTGQKTLQYYFACMQSLSNRKDGDPKHPPVYIRFTTKSFTPGKPLGWKEGDPVPEPMTLHSWHDVVPQEEVDKVLNKFNPANGVAINGVTAAGRVDQSSVPFEEPPQGVVDPKSIPSSNGQEEKTEFDSPEEEVAFLVEVAGDESGADEDAVDNARQRLKEMAIENGWTEEDVADPNKTWDDVGQMALNPPEQEVTEGIPAIGSKWKYIRRDKNGAKLKNSKGEQLPILEVEVSSVNKDEKTCTVHDTKDNRVVVDVKSRKPAVVKWEWLDPM